MREKWEGESKGREKLFEEEVYRAHKKLLIEKKTHEEEENKRR